MAINDFANAAQRNYSALAPQIHLTTDVLHYDAVGAFCGMNGGMFDKAFRDALRCRAIATSGKGIASANLQYLSMMPEFVLVRMGKWQSILDQPTPDNHWVYASVISHFARGMAYIRTGNRPAAKACLDSLQHELKDPILRQHSRPFNDPFKVANIAEGILEGEIEMARNQPETAITAFRHAIDGEDGLTYREPKYRPFPPGILPASAC